MKPVLNINSLYRHRKLIEHAGVLLFSIATYSIPIDIHTINAGSFSDTFALIIGFLQLHSLVLIALGVVLFISGICLDVFAKDWKFLQFILDAAQERAYKDQNSNGDPKHYHRVTLFKYHRIKFRIQHWSRTKPWLPWGDYYPWSGWLVPKIRSGHTTKNTKTVFVVPDSGNTEGIAGLAWSSRSAIVKRNLPEISSSHSKNRKKYAEETNCPRGFIDHILTVNKPYPRSIGAIPVFVNGEIWGVLVFDSRSEHGVPEKLANDFSITVSAIEKILGDSI